MGDVNRSPDVEADIGATTGAGTGAVAKGLLAAMGGGWAGAGTWACGMGAATAGAGGGVLWTAAAWEMVIVSWDSFNLCSCKQ